MYDIIVVENLRFRPLTRGWWDKPEKKNIREFKQNRGKCGQGLVGAVLLAPVVQKVDNAIYRISHYRLDSAVGFPNTYLLDKDLSSEQRYSTFKQLGPHIHVNSTFWERN